jgi:hypothetical protein
MCGHLRAYSTSDGKIVWNFDTLREFDSVNGVKTHGGSLSASGPAIAGGMLLCQFRLPIAGRDAERRASRVRG